MVFVGLQEEMEDMRLGEEEEEEAVAARNDAITTFKGHSGLCTAVHLTVGLSCT